jgi:hypothetical protein
MPTIRETGETSECRMLVSLHSPGDTGETNIRCPRVPQCIESRSSGTHTRDGVGGVGEIGDSQLRTSRMQLMVLLRHTSSLGLPIVRPPGESSHDLYAN